MIIKIKHQDLHHLLPLLYNIHPFYGWWRFNFTSSWDSSDPVFVPCRAVYWSADCPLWVVLLFPLGSPPVQNIRSTEPAWEHARGDWILKIKNWEVKQNSYIKKKMCQTGSCINCTKEKYLHNPPQGKWYVHTQPHYLAMNMLQIQSSLILWLHVRCNLAAPPGSDPTGSFEGGALAVLRGRLQVGDILESRNRESLSQGGSKELIS